MSERPNIVSIKNINFTMRSSKCDTFKIVSLRQAQTDNGSIVCKTLTILLFLLLSITDTSYAKNIDGEMQQAGNFYRIGEFDKAIEIYEELISEGYEGVSLYFNLGNSYYRIGKIGYAILNYERALKLSPSDEDVKHNLAFANLSTVDRIQPLPEFFLFEWWESILALLSVNGGTYITFFFYLLFLLCIVAYFFARTVSQQKLILFSGLATILLLLLSISLLIVKINKERNLIGGVIIEQSITVKTSPDPKSTDAFVIHEGLKVNLEDRLDEWVKIRLADGKVGWVENKAVERI